MVSKSRVLLRHTRFLFFMVNEPNGDWPPDASSPIDCQANLQSPQKFMLCFCPSFCPSLRRTFFILFAQVRPSTMIVESVDGLGGFAQKGSRLTNSVYRPRFVRKNRREPCRFIFTSFRNFFLSSFISHGTWGLHNEQCGRVQFGTDRGCVKHDSFVETKCSEVNVDA